MRPLGAAVKGPGCGAAIKFVSGALVRGIGTGRAEEIKGKGVRFCGADGTAA